MSVKIEKEPNWEFPDKLLDLNIEITHVKNYEILKLEKEDRIIIETMEGYLIAFKLPTWFKPSTSSFNRFDDDILSTGNTRGLLKS